MKHQLKRITRAVTLAASLSAALPIYAQPTDQIEVITLNPNGELKWTNLVGTNRFSIEWASSVEGPWHRDWYSLDSVPGIGGRMTNTVRVPMFYRVAEGYTTECVHGVWMTINGVNDYYIVQPNGVISEVSDLDARMPPGFCLVDTNWYHTNFNISITLLFETKPAVSFGARFDHRSDRLRVENPAHPWYVVEDQGRCLGQWSGVLTEDPTKAGATNYAVQFRVNGEGWVSEMVGLPGVVTGRMYAHSSGNVAGAFRTGDPEAYGRLHVSGSLTGDRIEGVYRTAADSTWGTVVLTRD